MFARLNHRFVLIAVAAAVASAALSEPARAQTATPLERFDPAPAGDPLFAVPSADAPGRLQPYGALAFSYAHAPLVLTGDDGSAAGRSKVANVVDGQITLHALLAIDVARRLKAEVDVPVTLAQNGNALHLGPARTIPAPSGGSLNDLRLGLRGQFLRQSGALPSAALSFAVWVPTGNDANYTSAGVTRFAPALIVGGSYPSLVYSVALGTHRQKDADASAGNLLGSDLFASAGVALREGALSVGPEFFGSTTSTSATSAFSRSSTNLEGLLGAKYRFGAFVAGAAGGAGLASGVGTPNYRIIASFAFAPEMTAPAESTLSPVEALPPPLPPAPPPPPPPPPPPHEAKTVEPMERPKPVETVADADADGIPDADDRCPSEAGVTQIDKTKNGCPEAAPKVVRTGAVDARGCPEPLTPSGVQAQLMDSVQFDYRLDTLRADAWPIMRRVLQVMKSHKEVQRFAVDGHTDDTGSEPINLGLARLRALNVYNWLVQNGVPPRRLEIRGFALYCPAIDAKTNDARQRNRRVEFRILR
ncbi:MAG TPA: OmpA family protein [Polyangiaceae bacterium]|nr:OmpA family protein [Polyangiaceae bacterium]